MSLSDVFGGLLDGLLSLLPTSPFQQFVAEFAALPYLGWLNWFFPVGKCLDVLVSWCAAIALFYLYSVIMRWLKLIGD